jgi:hypothetical protein
MDKKPFDHIENKIKEAADNSSQFPFEEQSWDKMETLLDKGKKRPAFVWWWFALPALMIAGAGMYWLHAHNTNTTIANTITVKSTVNNVTASNTSSTTNTISTNNKTVAANTTTTDATIIDNTRHYTKAGHSYKLTTRGKTRARIKQTSQIDDVTDAAQSSPVIVDKTNDKKETINTSSDSTSKLSVENTIKKPLIKKDTIVSLVKKDDKKKPSSAHGFYVLAMGGIDAADVHLLSFDNSTVTPRFGAGIGYQLNNKWSIQTGFYAGRKKYIAGPADYKAKPGTYYATVDITKVDANCLVYDIPVTIRYNFNSVWYATAGISSFIMKNEAYNYNYTDAGVAYTGAKTYTGNQSLFSILNVSAGYEKLLNNRFSLLAEPSVSIPLAGVGAGSVKLYSTSLMIGLKYRFSKK